jgi:hypothetical protein
MSAFQRKMSGIFRVIRVGFAFLIVWSAGLWPGRAVAAPVWSDPLTGAQIDTNHWTVGTPNPGLTLVPTSMGVLMTVASSAHNPDFGVALVSRCLLTGDFDVQVDYQLGLWPDHTGVRTALSMNDTPTTNNCAIERVSLSTTADVAVQMPGSEVYVASIIPSQPFPDVATTDTQGTLRLTRTGSTETAYFASAGGGWTTVYSATNNMVPVYGALSMWSSDEYRSTPGGGSSIYFRNYVVNSGQLSCPDAGTSDALAGDASPGDAAAKPDGGGADGGGAAGGGKSSASGCGCDLGAGDSSQAAVGLALLSLAMLATLLRRDRPHR